MCHKMDFAERINKFNKSLNYKGDLPEDISIMNPFRENACALPASEKFYRKYYGDKNKRFTILGINPGRFGAGITGVPFTDPVRLEEKCGIYIPECPKAREPSSVFVYEFIKYYGGVEKFYSQWYINSVCPLGFTRKNSAGRDINYNYYDNKELERAVTPFIIQTLHAQISCGLETGICFCFGKNKNFHFLKRLNTSQKFFEEIIPLDHPRYIMQYKSKEMQEYTKKYAQIFSGLTGS